MTKLVTILARELAEWPDEDTKEFDVKFITQDEDADICSWENDGPLVFDDGAWRIEKSLAVEDRLVEGAQLAEDYTTAIVTREMWQAERERVSTPEWDGDGLPPVGVECEYRSGYIEWPYTYSACRIIAHFKGESGDMLAAFTHVAHDGVVQVSRGAAELFRRPQSPRDKWIQKACEAMKQARFSMQNTDVPPMDLAELYAGAVHDAGLAKEV